MMRSAALTRLRSISPPMMQPARKAWSSGIAPLHLGVVSTGAPSRSASCTSSGEALAQSTPRPTIRIGRLARGDHVERRLQVAIGRAGS